jgi:16S rRNA (cytosine967-C5)-methyltransferase
VFRAEGQAGIDAFLQRQRAAQALPSAFPQGHLLPIPDNEGFSGDGFFYALMGPR